MTASPNDITPPPPGEWTFENTATAKGFDTHVRGQLPWYDLMTEATLHVARHYIPHKGHVYDFGCSTGNIGKKLADTLALRKASFTPVDNSTAMSEQYDGPGNIVVADMATMDLQPFDVAICFLSLMFVPVKDRRPFLNRLQESARPGGCIFIVDKMEARGGYTATINARLTLLGKRQAGVSCEDIVAKELSLMGVQRPLQLNEISATAVQVFQWGEFAGFVIET